MRCPYLREHRVHHCGLGSERLLIPICEEDPVEQRCTSTRYVECPLLHERGAPTPAGARCPYLHEGIAETCTAEPYRRLVLLSDDMLLRCHSDSHMRCPTFLAQTEKLSSEGCSR